jgi:LuxR family maltose regulon positive regulatory protein
MSCWQVRLWLVQDNLSDASRWVEERDLDIDEVLDPSREMDLSQLLDYTALFDYLVLARILLARHRLGQAAELLRRLLKAAEAGGRGTRMIEIRMLQALVRQAGDDTDTAMDALERALALAEPEGFVRAFVDEGPAMAQLLYEALSRGIAPGYIRRLLSAFPAEAPASPPSSEVHRPSSDLFEPLSDRELEVLQLIAEGLTNREIATRLFLSSHTIKTHTRNIYGKLDAHSRTQAVTRAQALGILPTG